MKDTLGAKGTAQGPVGNSSRSPSSATVHRVKGIQSVGSGEHREFWLLYGVSRQNISSFLSMKLLF